MVSHFKLKYAPSSWYWVFCPHLPPTPLPPHTHSLVYTWGGGSCALAEAPRVPYAFSGCGHRYCRPQFLFPPHITEPLTEGGWHLSGSRGSQVQKQRSQNRPAPCSVCCHRASQGTLSEIWLPMLDNRSLLQITQASQGLDCLSLFTPLKHVIWKYSPKPMFL